ncbi:uncharacterized protein LOC121385267 [Gigantopelta aegis]|uniref:uncharacterized protein LOC121385267 n=1 Tax=Gigantopelta aegis TaxID=1735272 RepID=UPI001B88A275|nr:uncharacterized protein LOC121385267 [Gigantopelta aegis]
MRSRAKQQSKAKRRTKRRQQERRFHPSEVASLDNDNESSGRHMYDIADSTYSYRNERGNITCEMETPYEAPLPENERLPRSNHAYYTENRDADYQELDVAKHLKPGRRVSKSSHVYDMFNPRDVIAQQEREVASLDNDNESSGQHMYGIADSTYSDRNERGNQTCEMEIPYDAPLPENEQLPQSKHAHCIAYLHDVSENRDADYQELDVAKHLKPGRRVSKSSHVYDMFNPRDVIACSCNHCVPVPSKDGEFCCQMDSDIKRKMTSMRIQCITQHEGFLGNCLNLHVIEAAFYEFLENNGPLGSEQAIHKVYRHLAYKNFTRWIWRKLGQKTRKALPSCVNHVIRSNFPSENSAHIGFEYPR